MCAKMSLHKGGRGRQMGAGSLVEDMGTRWNCALFVGLYAYQRKMNSNKIRHRCALLAQTSFGRSLGGGLVTWK